MIDRKYHVHENDIPKIQYLRRGSPLVIDIQKAFDPEVTGTHCGIMAIVTIPPRSDHMVPHSHREYEELEYVIAGEGIATVGPDRDSLKEIPCSAGDFFYFPAGYLHAYRNSGNTPMRVLICFCPEDYSGLPMSEISSRLTDVPLR